MRQRFALGSAVLLTLLACNGRTERSRADFERMRRQQRASPYGPSSAFANGMSMRIPPLGTLSREEFALGEAIATGQRSGQYVTQSPIDLTREQRHDGDVDFQVYCAVCHGQDGAGGTVVGSNLRPPPPSLLTDSARRLTDGQLFAIVTNGRGRMPPYNWALRPVERWGVISALRSLQRQH